MYDGKITLLTTIWNRRKHLEEFLSRWLDQPQIDEIIVWDNSGQWRPEKVDTRVKIINSSFNYGGYIRDVASHFAKNDVVVVSDDDIMVDAGFVAEMAKHYEPDRFLGIWGKEFHGSYASATAIRADEIDRPVLVECMVGLVYMIDRKYLFPVDHRNLMWTCYDIHLSGIFKTMFPELKKMVVPVRGWRLTEEEGDANALNRHPDAAKEKQALYERYFKNAVS